MLELKKWASWLRGASEGCNQNFGLTYTHHNESHKHSTLSISEHFDLTKDLPQWISNIQHTDIKHLNCISIYYLHHTCISQTYETHKQKLNILQTFKTKQTLWNHSMSSQRFLTTKTKEVRATTLQQEKRGREKNKRVQTRRFGRGGLFRSGAKKAWRGERENERGRHFEFCCHPEHASYHKI